MTDPIEIARRVIATFQVSPGVYLLGSLESGLTVYKQQLRAHNLTWALWKLSEAKEAGFELNSVAVVGGGISGLTAVSCILSILPKAEVTLFEQFWGVCPLQQGCDSRWLHPRIYEWPTQGSRVPSASLPLLNWSEGRAADVTRQIVQDFSNVCKTFDREGSRLEVYLGANAMHISAGKKQIRGKGSPSTRKGVHFLPQAELEVNSTFDVIILATGFGIETQPVDYPSLSYWRNDCLAQPILEQNKRTYVISGYGDGAVIDLCRLSLEHFRQDTILDDLFGDKLEDYEVRMSQKRNNSPVTYEFFESIESDLLERALSEISDRLRKDTHVILHIGGRESRTQTVKDIVGRGTSFLNSMLLYLLSQLNSFSTSCSDLESTVKASNTPNSNVIVRHGTSVMKNLSELLSDYNDHSNRLVDMRSKERQEAKRLWELGCFPVAK